MSSQVNGIPGNVAFSGALAIVSSTNTSPIQVTTAAHGRTTGDKVSVYGHATNYAANGQWTVTVISPTILSLDASVGVGVGGATGHVQPLAAKTFAVPSDGDPRSAASVDVALEALADRTAFALVGMGQYKMRLINDLTVTGTAANWSTATIASAGTWYPFAGGPWPAFVIQDATIHIASQPFDLLEFQLDTTVFSELTGGIGFATQQEYEIGLYMGFAEPGASPGSYAVIPGSVKGTIQNVAGGSSGVGQTAPITLVGRIFHSQITAPDVYIQPYATSAFMTGVVNFAWDYTLSLRQWRKTGMVQ